MANERTEVSEARKVRLGRLPRKSNRRALMAADFPGLLDLLDVPETTRYWRGKAKLPNRSYGNTLYGDCTRAKQAVAITRMERIEQRRLVQISDQEVLDRYSEMSQRRYGGGDNGAYEVDALDDWRNPDTTIRDVDGHPYTIDAYLGVNPANLREVRAALAFSRAHGLPFCINLPAAFAGLRPPQPWHVPPGQALTGEWQPGSWGGHSMWLHEASADGPVADHTWDLDPQLITWDAWAAYVDEVHIVIDSVNRWRKAATSRKVKGALGDVADAVNAVSDIKVEL